MLFLLGQLCYIVLFNHFGNNCGLNSCFYDIYMAKISKYSRIQTHGQICIHAKFAYTQIEICIYANFAYMQKWKNAFTWPGLLT